MVEIKVVVLPSGQLQGGLAADAHALPDALWVGDGDGNGGCTLGPAGGNGDLRDANAYKVQPTVGVHHDYVGVCGGPGQALQHGGLGLDLQLQLHRVAAQGEGKAAHRGAGFSAASAKADAGRQGATAPAGQRDVNNGRVVSRVLGIVADVDLHLSGGAAHVHLYHKGLFAQVQGGALAHLHLGLHLLVPEKVIVTGLYHIPQHGGKLPRFHILLDIGKPYRLQRIDIVTLGSALSRLLLRGKHLKALGIGLYRRGGSQLRLRVVLLRLVLHPTQHQLAQGRRRRLGFLLLAGDLIRGYEGVCVIYVIREHGGRLIIVVGLRELDHAPVDLVSIQGLPGAKVLVVLRPGVKLTLDHVVLLRLLGRLCVGVAGIVLGLHLFAAKVNVVAPVAPLVHHGGFAVTGVSANILQTVFIVKLPFILVAAMGGPDIGQIDAVGVIGELHNIAVGVHAHYGQRGEAIQVDGLVGLVDPGIGSLVLVGMVGGGAVRAGCHVVLLAHPGVQGIVASVGTHEPDIARQHRHGSYFAVNVPFPGIRGLLHAVVCPGPVGIPILRAYLLIGGIDLVKICHVLIIEGKGKAGAHSVAPSGKGIGVIGTLATVVQVILQPLKHGGVCGVIAIGAVGDICRHIDQVPVRSAVGVHIFQCNGTRRRRLFSISGVIVGPVVSRQGIGQVQLVHLERHGALLGRAVGGLGIAHQDSRGLVHHALVLPGGEEQIFAVMADQCAVLIPEFLLMGGHDGQMVAVGGQAVAHIFTVGGLTGAIVGMAGVGDGGGRRNGTIPIVHRQPTRQVLIGQDLLQVIFLVQIVVVFQLLILDPDRQTVEIRVLTIGILHPGHGLYPNSLDGTAVQLAGGRLIGGPAILLLVGVAEYQPIVAAAIALGLGACEGNALDLYVVGDQVFPGVIAFKLGPVSHRLEYHRHCEAQLILTTANAVNGVPRKGHGPLYVRAEHLGVVADISAVAHRQLGHKALLLHGGLHLPSLIQAGGELALYRIIIDGKDGVLIDLGYLNGTAEHPQLSSGTAGGGELIVVQVPALEHLQLNGILSHIAALGALGDKTHRQVGGNAVELGQLIAGGSCRHILRYSCGGGTVHTGVIVPLRAQIELAVTFQC